MMTIISILVCMKQFLKAKTACRLAARSEILSLCKTFLKHVREVNSLIIDTKTDFGDPSRSAHSESFY